MGLEKKTFYATDMLPEERIESKIYLIRGRKVMLDWDLAALYQVETRVLNQAVSRNRERFPEDFMFALTREEIRNLSQNVISSLIKHAPNVNVFTERALRCCPASCGAIALSWSIFRLYGFLQNYGS
jgi:hypothetical protein